MKTLVTLASDNGYFPLAKGLILSLLAAPRGDFAVGFVDIGCGPKELEWLHARRVMVRAPAARIMGGLADREFGYHRAQTCRPFLPELFPGARAIVWLDCDTWLQDSSAIEALSSAALRDPDRIAICPESHPSYRPLHEKREARRAELFAYYSPAFGAEVAADMCARTVFNTGVFAMDATSPIWGAWARSVRELYLGRQGHRASPALHMGEQMSLNVLIARMDCATALDPLLNYLCLWNPPRRDADGVVRIADPPRDAPRIVHLAGGWKWFGQRYLDAGLLYESGAYLSADDLSRLCPQTTEGQAFAMR